MSTHPISVNYRADSKADGVPTHLFDYADCYHEQGPLRASQEWFSEATMGLAVDYTLKSLLGKADREWGGYDFSSAAHRGLLSRFSCAHFSATDIVELAVATGARYVFMTARDEDGFCLFESETTDFTSVKSAGRRHILGEISSTCEYHGLGLILRYHYPLPHEADGSFALAEQQLRELLIGHGGLAGLVVDGLPAAYGEELKQMCRALQPQMLLELRDAGDDGLREFCTWDHRLPARGVGTPALAGKTWQWRVGLAPDNYGFCPDLAGKHHSSENVWMMLAEAIHHHVNFLPSTALMPDGSLDLEDINVLLAVGERLEKNGYPS